MSIMFGGDPESFMEAPRMENKSVSESLGVSPIAAFLDLIGVHRQAAKGPKKKKGEESAPAAGATVPAVLTDVESVLAPTETPITPIVTDAPMSTWGQRWLDSNRPLTRIDPNDYAR